MNDSNIKDLLKVGEKYDIYLSEGNINNCKIEVRAIVDDYAVVRALRKDGTWCYQLNRLIYYKVMAKNGYIKQIPPQSLDS